MVKNRAYGSRGDAAAASAHAALALALDTLLRLFAPFIPFAAEEVWSWWREGSVHNSQWPDSAPLVQTSNGTAPEVMTAAGQALSDFRRIKTEAGRSLRTGLTKAVLCDGAEVLVLLQPAIDDVAEAAAAGSISLNEAATRSVTASLAPEDK